MLSDEELKEVTEADQPGTCEADLAQELLLARSVIAAARAYKYPGSVLSERLAEYDEGVHFSEGREST